MKARILGYAVLVYAALTSGVVLDLVRFILKPGSGGWWALGDSVLWLAFVSGGFGLIFGRAWSRLVLLVAAAAAVVQSIVGMVFLSESGTPMEAVLINAVMILPPVAIFVGALSLPAPAAWEVQPSSGPAAQRVVSTRKDLAYGCFVWIAFVLCAVPLMSLLPLDFTTRQVLGMLVGIPVALATLAAGLAAVVLSIVEWREWPLVTMSAVSASMLLFIIAEDEWNLVGGDVALAWYVGSTAVLIFFCARWFAFTRR
ncbi:MAG TPA: hypothetical protein VMR52_12390 [Dehalococcoidia bacterium]|nr:hypothetical protein [Dehalococcoidia bacterium]